MVVGRWASSMQLTGRTGVGAVLWTTVELGLGSGLGMTSRLTPLCFDDALYSVAKPCFTPLFLGRDYYVYLPG